MATWVSLTEDDVLAGMTVRERDDFAKTSVGVSVADRLAPILENMVAEIRGHIASHSGNTLSADASLIPAEVKRHAVALVRWDVLSSIPGYTPGDARKAAYEAANSYFAKVAEGRIRPASADDAVATEVSNPTPAPRPRITARKRRYTRDQQDGI